MVLDKANRIVKMTTTIMTIAPNAKAVESDNSHIDQHTEYDILTNNCHRFAASCLLGVMQKPMGIKELITAGGYSIAYLEDVIVNRLNGGNPIC